MAPGGTLVKQRRARHSALVMSKDDPTREERLAAKLRENLRRRKAQSRDLDAADEALSKKPERS